MKVWITKYALTKGVFESNEGELKGNRFIEKYNKFCAGVYSKSDYELTKEEAIKSAEKKRIKKIASLQKQIKEIESLKF